MTADEEGSATDRGRTAAAWTTPLNPLILLYLTLTLISFLISPLPQRSWPYLIQAAGGVAGFLIVYAWLDRPARLRWLLQRMVWAAGALSLAGLFLVEWPSQYLFDLRPFLARLPHLPLPFFIHPNAMAGALLPPFCLGWGLYRLEMSPGRRTLLTVSIALMALMLLLTQSRNAWLGLLAAGAVYKLWGRFRFAYFALGVGVLIALPLTVNWLPESGLTWLEQSVARMDDASKAGEADDPSWLSRLEIWRVAGQMAADYPALGAGLYVFEPVSRANYRYVILPPEFSFTHTHNLFWQTAVNLGVVGLLTALAMWGVALAGLWRRRPQLALDGGDWTAVVGAALVSSLWFNLFDLVSWEMKAGVVIWLLIAVALRLSPAQKRAKTTLLAGVLLMMWLILLLSPLGRENWRRLQLDQAQFGAVPSERLTPR
jgi:putative inorganic carbon (HCO3(-)) transporter